MGGMAHGQAASDRLRPQGAESRQDRQSRPSGGRSGRSETRLPKDQLVALPALATPTADKIIARPSLTSQN